MVTSRVEEIVALQMESAGPSLAASVKKWAEAELINQEHAAGKSFPVMSEEIRAAGGRGSSLGYLSRMDRCWKITVVDTGMEGFTYDTLPPFNDVYGSDEIRIGSEDRKRRAPREGNGAKHGKGTAGPADSGPEHDYTAHGLAAAAHESLSILAANQAYWPLLTEDDMAAIRALPGYIHVIMDEASLSSLLAIGRTIIVMNLFLPIGRQR